VKLKYEPPNERDLLPQILSLISARLKWLWTEALDMTSAMTEDAQGSMHDDVATLRRSFRGVRGDV